MLGTSVAMWNDYTWYVIAACAVVLIVVLVLYLVIGRRQQQVINDQPWQEVLNKLPVAVVGKFFRLGSRVTSREFVATLMSLQSQGFITVKNSRAFINREKSAELDEPVAQEALKLLEIMAEDTGELKLSSIYDKVAERKIKDKLETAYPKWKDVVDRSAKAIEPAASNKGRLKLVLKYLSYALVLLALISFNTLGLASATAFLVVGLSTLGISTIIRESLSPVQVAAKELYEWLTSSKSDQPLPQDVENCNQLLVYARTFDIERQVLKRMKSESPEAAADDRLISLDFWARFEANAFTAPR